MRPHLEGQQWTEEWSHRDTDREFRREEMDIEDPPLFTGTIDWLVDGPPDLLFDEVATRGRIEEKLFVNSPEWRHQATIQLVRNVLRWGVIDLDDQGTDNSVLADHLFVTITLEATAPNGRDGLEISFGDSDWEPLGGIKRGGGTNRQWCVRVIY